MNLIIYKTYIKMFLKKIPIDSKIVLSVVFGSLVGGLGLGVKKMMYSPDVIIKKNKNRTTFDLDNGLFLSE